MKRTLYIRKPVTGSPHCYPSSNYTNLTRSFVLLLHSISLSARSSSSSSSFFLPTICFPLLRLIYVYTSLLPSSIFPLSLTGWARYLLPAETSTKLKARTLSVCGFLHGALQCPRMQALYCPRDSLPADPTGPWENTETIIARDLWCTRRPIRESISWITRPRDVRERIGGVYDRREIVSPDISSFGYSAAAFDRSRWTLRFVIVMSYKSLRHW